MVQVVIAHVIGTVSLLLLFSIVGVYSVIYYSSLQTQTINVQLQDIADHVSFQLSGMISLHSISTQDQTLIKKISIPNDFGETFTISLVRSEDKLMVLVQGNSPSKVFGSSSLPWSAGGNFAIFNGTDPGESDPKLTKMLSVDGGLTNIAIWSQQTNGKVTFGLGTYEG